MSCLKHLSDHDFSSSIQNGQFDWYDYAKSTEFVTYLFQSSRLLTEANVEHVLELIKTKNIEVEAHTYNPLKIPSDLTDTARLRAFRYIQSFGGPKTLQELKWRAFNWLVEQGEMFPRLRRIGYHLFSPRLNMIVNCGGAYVERIAEYMNSGFSSVAYLPLDLESNSVYVFQKVHQGSGENEWLGSGG